jgi:hypothetical protein
MFAGVKYEYHLFGDVLVYNNMNVFTAEQCAICEIIIFELLAFAKY